MEAIGREQDGDGFIVLLTSDEYIVLRRLQEAVAGMTISQSFVGSPAREVYRGGLGLALLAIEEWVSLKFSLNELQGTVNAFLGLMGEKP